MFITALDYLENKSLDLNTYNIQEVYTTINKIKPKDTEHPYLVVLKCVSGKIYYEGYATEQEAEDRKQAISEIIAGGGLVQRDSFGDFPEKGSKGAIYLAKDTGQTYYWDPNSISYIPTGTSGRTGIYSTAVNLPTVFGQSVTLNKSDLSELVTPTVPYSEGSEIISANSAHAVIVSSTSNKVTARIVADNVIDSFKQVNTISDLPATGQDNYLYFIKDITEFRVWNTATNQYVQAPVKPTGVNNSQIHTTVSSNNEIEATLQVESISKSHLTQALQTDLDSLTILPTFDSTTNQITFTTLGGTTYTIDLPVENAVDSVTYNSTTKIITIHKIDDSTSTIDLSDLANYTEGDGIDIDGTTISLKIDPTSAHGLNTTSDGLTLDLATTSSAGAMSSTDKTKLDSLENYDDTEIRNELDDKVDKEAGKGLSTEDFTTAEKTKLASIEEDAQENTIEVIKINGTAQTITNKEVDIPVPEYTIVKNTVVPGRPTTYNLLKDNVITGDTIEIPENSIIKSGSIETVDTPDVPYPGAQVGDKYIDLVLDTDPESHIYIPLKDIAVDYTAGDGINIDSSNVISVVIDSTNANGLSVSSDGLSLSEATTTDSGAMSSTDKTKLDSIEANAQENVNPDWEATSGDAEILNKPTTIAGYGITDAYTKTEVDDLVDVKQDIIQYETLPEATLDNVGQIAQFIGTTTSTYTQGYFYQVIESSDMPPVYSWENIEVQPVNGTASDISYDNTNSSLTSTNVQDAIDELDSNITDGLDNKVDKETGKGLSTNDYSDADKAIVDSITDALANKVDKETGKGLSTNDYSDADKSKLDDIEAEAQVNIIESVEVNGITATIDSNKKASVTIPTGTIDSISLNSNPLTIDTNKNVDIPLVTTTDDGAMSSTDKTKLDNIEADADVNSIESISVNSTTVTPDANKNVNITVPTKTSDLTNDSDFVDADVDYLTNYYTKDDIDTKISHVFTYKGSVRTYAQLPTTDQQVGDVYNVATADTEHHIKAGDNVAWTGTEWDVLAGDVDLSNYYTKTQTNTLLSNKINEPLMDGTAGQVLTTNGAGGRSWTTVQGGGDAGHWSTIVTCNVGATSCTINDANIKATSTIEEFTENTSNTQVAVLSRTISSGKIVLTFDPLTEQTKFKLHIWDETNPPTPTTYQVSFDSHGGTSVPTQTVTVGDTATVPTDPTKSGSTFAGWYTEDTYENLYNFNSPVVGDIELHAKWETI